MDGLLAHGMQALLSAGGVRKSSITDFLKSTPFVASWIYLHIFVVIFLGPGSLPILILPCVIHVWPREQDSSFGRRENPLYACAQFWLWYLFCCSWQTSKAQGRSFQFQMHDPWLGFPQTSESHKKKRNTNAGHDKRNQFPLSFDSLLYPTGGSSHGDDDSSFDDVIETLLPGLLRTRASLLEQYSDYDEQVLFAFYPKHESALNGMPTGCLCQASHSIRDIISAHH